MQRKRVYSVFSAKHEGRLISAAGGSTQDSDTGKTQYMQSINCIYCIILPSTANDSIPSGKLILNKYNPTTAKSNATQRQLKPTFSFCLVSGGHTIKVQVLAQLINAGAGR